MPRFSDSPYHLLRDFFEAKDIKDHPNKPEIDYDWDVVFMSQDRSTGWDLHFDDLDVSDAMGIDGVLFVDWFNNTWNINWHFNPNKATTDGSYLAGPKMNILTKGDGLHDLFIKEEGGYIPITVKHTGTDGNTFNFYNHGPNEYLPGDTITDTLSGNFYEFIDYNKTIKWVFNDVKNNYEVYFRKDSLYHTWVKEDAHDYYQQEWNADMTIRNHMNYDSVFSYFGKIFKSHDSEHCRVFFNGMKDFVVSAIPEHQRTPNFKNFLEIFFDMHYQENYNLLKNIFTLFDPMEIDYKYLDYLSKYYSMLDVPVNLNTNSREFVSSLPWLLKRKGTYTEFHIIWKIISNTSNYLNIYEKWHDNTLIGTVPISAYDEYLYVNKPEYGYTVPTDGAGEEWYRNNYPCTIPEYNTNGEVLSTHYRLEIDLSKEPLDDNTILSKEIWDYLHNYWEYLRPINRVSSYRVLIAPITNFSGFMYSLYPPVKKSFCNSKSSKNDLYQEGAYVHVQDTDTPSDVWSVTHNLNSTDVIIQVVDQDLNEIIPEKIEYIGTNTISVTLYDEIVGYVLVRKSHITIRRYPPVINEQWNIFHMRGERDVITQFTDTEKEYSKSTIIVDQDTVSALIGYDKKNALIRKGDFVGIQSTPSKSWIIPHDLDVKGVITSVYDENNEQIQPSSYKIVSSDNISLEFDEPQLGYVVLCSIGYLSFDDLIDEFEDSIDTYPPTYRLGVSIGDIEDDIILVEGDVTSTYSTNDCYYFDIELPLTDTYNFSEIAIYDNNNNQIFYTECSPIYKPDNSDLTIHYRVKKSLDNV